MIKVPTTNRPDRSSVGAHPPSAPLLDDQNYSWGQGRHVRIEQYVDDNPWLSSDPECLLDLIYNEVRLREEAGEAPQQEEYCRRFPQLVDPLGVQFEVHRAMRPGAILADPTGPEPDDEVRSSAPSIPAIDGYEVLGEIGRGAMGVVYEARDLRLNRRVALKMILTGPHAGPKERARFETEARAVARLQHPHIVQIHAIGEQDGRPYLCLEIVAGGSLAQRLAGRPLPPRHAAELLELLARAVHFAHKEQIVHRDLKPANVLLASSDSCRGVRLRGSKDIEYFEPKITDFGLAKLLDQATDMSGPSGGYSTAGAAGTPPYMAPEQAGRSAGTAYTEVKGGGRLTDVYALGAILYETLTGRPPFMAATVYETLRQVVSLEPVPPRRLQPQVPRDLEIICLACLRKEPRRRYGTALEVADDLRRFLDGRPIRQRPSAVWEPAVKWARRRPAVAAWVVFAIASLVGLAASGLYYARHFDEWARLSASDRYHQFIRQRDQAMFQGTLLAVARELPQERAAADLAAGRDAARAALALAGVEINGNAILPRDPRLTVTEQDDVAVSCYELLLILARAVGESPPAATAEEQTDLASQALGILERAERLGPPTRALHLLRARLLALRDDGSVSDEERHLADAIDPVNAGDYYFTGVDHYERGETADAIRSFYEALRLRPNHFEAHYFLAISALNAGRPAEARAGFTACIGLRSEFAWPYVLRGFAAAQDGAPAADVDADFAAALARDNGATVRYAVQATRGYFRLRDGELDEAISFLEAAVAARPDECPAHVTLADALQQQGRFADAAREIDLAVRLRPDLPQVYRARGRLNLERPDLQAALRDLDAAIARAPAGRSSANLASDYVERGRVKHTLGQFQDAISDYDRALTASPDSAIAHHLRGEALLSLNRPREAEQAFGQSLRLRPAFGPALRARGEARVKTGDFAGAAEDYTRALALDRDASILIHRGWAYFFSDAWKLAERDFEEAIQLDPAPGDAHVGRGLARVMLGDYQRAVADANAVLAAGKPDAPEMMHNVACVFSLAAARVRADEGVRGRDAVAATYQRQALAALRKTLLQLPAGQRLAYWRDKMRPDAALDPIRRSPEFVQFDEDVRSNKLGFSIAPNANELPR